MTRMNRVFLFIAVVALVLGGAGAAPAQTAAAPTAAAPTMERRAPALDTTVWFQAKCGACHARAGPLMRERLSLTSAGALVTNAGVDLRDFMRGHFGSPDEREIAAIYGALRRIAQGQGRFHLRCGICHASAEGLARKSLILRDGTLFGRYSGRDIAEFLLRHGTDSAEEAAFFASVLSRQLTAGP